MNTFCAVNDAALIRVIKSAQKRLVYVSPGIHEDVAKVLSERFHEVDGIDVTAVLDSGDDVCRIGYGDAKDLALLYAATSPSGFWLGQWTCDFDAAQATEKPGIPTYE